jgi:hypothetical protein
MAPEPTTLLLARIGLSLVFIAAYLLPLPDRPDIGCGYYDIINPDVVKPIGAAFIDRNVRTIDFQCIQSSELQIRKVRSQTAVEPEGYAPVAPSERVRLHHELITMPLTAPRHEVLPRNEGRTEDAACRVHPR